MRIEDVQVAIELLELQINKGMDSSPEIKKRLRALYKRL